MQTIKTDKVRKVFYKDGTEKPNWKMFDIDEIFELAELVVPDNKYEFTYTKNLLRSIIYSVMEYEKNQQGRSLISVKIKGKNAIYGFTKKKEYIMNFIERAQKRIENQRHKLKIDSEVLESVNPNIQLTLFDIGE